MLLSIIAGIIVVLIGVGIWCAWRFLKKKKPKGAAEGGEDDEAGLVGNEEEVAEEIEAPKEVESQGKIHYKLEYDFTTQELKVTVSKLFQKRAKISLVMEQSALHFVQHNPIIRFPHMLHIVTMLEIY